MENLKTKKLWDTLREHPFLFTFGIYIGIAMDQWLGCLLGYISLEKVLFFTFGAPLLLLSVYYIRKIKYQRTFGRIVIVVGGGAALGWLFWISLNYLLFVPTWAPFHENHGPLNTVAFVLSTALSYSGAAYLMDRLGKRRDYRPIM